VRDALADDGVFAAETGVMVLSLVADGPDVFSIELPTIIGVGDTRGRIAVGLIAGIVSVFTSFTGVGVGSTLDCENADADIRETNNATQKNFVFIDRCSGDLLLKRVLSRCRLWCAHVAKDSLINKKVVKLKTFIYINHKDKLCRVARIRGFRLPYRLELC